MGSFTLDTLTSAVDVGERRSALERLKAALTIHNATEEHLIYPAIERIAREKAEGERLYHETAQAENLARSVRQFRGSLHFEIPA